MHVKILFYASIHSGLLFVEKESVDVGLTTP